MRDGRSKLMAEQTETKKTIRAAGLWYLAFLVLSGFGMMWADRQFYVPGDIAATIHNLTGRELLFKAGALSVLAGYVCFLVLVNVLYRLLAPTGEDLARLMVIFVVTGVAVAFLNRLVQLSVLLVLDGNGPAAAMGTGAQDVMVMTLFDVHRSGEWLAGFFWGYGCYHWAGSSAGPGCSQSGSAACSWKAAWPTSSKPGCTSWHRKPSPPPSGSSPAPWPSQKSRS